MKNNKTHIDFLHQYELERAHRDFFTDEVVELDEYANLKDMETNMQKRFKENRRRNNENNDFSLSPTEPESPTKRFLMLVAIVVLSFVAVLIIAD